MPATRRKTIAYGQPPVSVRPSSAEEREGWEGVLEPGEGLSSFLRRAAAVEQRRREEERERRARDPAGVLLANLDELLAEAQRR